MPKPVFQQFGANNRADAAALPLTASKPDVELYFPVSDVERGAGTPEVSALTRRLSANTLTQIEYLTKLQYGKLPVMPNSTKYMQEVKPAHRRCFPRAVCECKRPEKSNTDEKVRFQVANCAAVCLEIFRHLPIRPECGSSLKNIMPVIALTFIGSLASVWIAYIKESGGSIK